MFRSKKDIWMGVIIWASILLFINMLYDGFVTRSVILIIVAIGLLLFIGSIWFFTRYIIEGEKLIVQYGFIKQDIDIEKITSIRRTKNIFTAPALSLNRIEINYHPYETTQISPKHARLFIETLQKINPNIRINES